MPASLRLIQVRRVASTGRVYLRFSDDLILEFATSQEAREWARDIDLDDPSVRDLLRKFLVRWWMVRDPTSATPATVEGKTITFDLSSATPLTVA